MASNTLSERSRIVLEAIAEGRSYDQIINSGSASSYPEIFQAAAKALALIAGAPPRDSAAYHARMEKIRAKHPRAYEAWSVKEECQLADLFTAGTGLKEIAAVLQRQPGAIRARLKKLGLVADTDDPSAAIDEIT